MKNKLLLLAGALSFALAGAAIAGQPLTLSDAQLDRVVAGAVGSAVGAADALGNLQAQTVTLALSSADFGPRKCPCDGPIGCFRLLPALAGSGEFSIRRDRASALVIRDELNGLVASVQRGARALAPEGS
jgi:hypothetical protein